VTDGPLRVLVASDFHLGSGWDPVTNTYVATENYLADGTFRAWVRHYAERATETLLILNGDTFDVLRSPTPISSAGLSGWGSSRNLRPRTSCARPCRNPSAATA
jgi:hypothetical protein